MKSSPKQSTPGGRVATLAERDVAALAARGVERTFSRGAVVVSEGDTTDALFIILSGRVKVFVADREGHELVLGEMGAGEYFGEMVLDGGPRSASIMTLEKTRFAIVSREAFVEYLNANPAFALRLIKQLIHRVRTLTGSVKSLALLDVYGRVARLLIEQAKPDGGDWAVPGRLTHQEIASRIGSSREMVTRILKDLQNGGYIVIEPGRILVKKELPAHW
jgi:CRP/FNR family cyclic AMP-dependent transcriptional regulator